MVGLVFIIICYLGWKAYQASCDSAYNSYDHTNLDGSKMFEDRWIKGQSAAQIRRNVVHGKYDKK